jgi:hypothetical protein
MVMQSGALAVLANGDADVAMEPGTWSVTNFPATATQATITKPAGGAGVRHICRGVSVAIAAGATPQTPIRVVLRDGLTGAGIILWSKTLAVPANQSASVDLSPLTIVGSPNTAMTLEFTAAGVAASQEDVTLLGVTMQN